MNTQSQEQNADDTTDLLREEVRLLRHQLAQADRRLAQSERRVLLLQTESETAQVQAQRARSQLRQMRSHPGWRFARAVLVAQEKAQDGAKGALRALRTFKRKVIG